MCRDYELINRYCCNYMSLIYVASQSRDIAFGGILVNLLNSVAFPIDKSMPVCKSNISHRM